MITRQKTTKVNNRRSKNTTRTQTHYYFYSHGHRSIVKKLKIFSLLSNASSRQTLSFCAWLKLNHLVNESLINKKVLLRERKRHTACRVVSTPSLVLTGYPPWQGTPHPDLARGYPTWVPPWWGTPHPDLGGTPLQQGTPRQGTPRPDLVGGTLPGYPQAGYPPGVCPMAFWEILQSIMGYGYPPGICPMAFWEMLQSIMGYGYPPWCLPHGILGNVAKHNGIWVPPCRQTDWWMEGQTRVKTLPSRRNTYAGGKN